MTRAGLLLALLSLAAAELTAADSLAQEVPGADEECSALQVRVQAGAAESGGPAKWYLGVQGASCTQACWRYGATCSQSDLATVRDVQTIFSAASQAGSKCKLSRANDGQHGQAFSNVPAVCTLAHCGADPQGLCAYDRSGKSSCEGAPAAGYSRLCPCAAGVPSTSARPAPQAPTPAGRAPGSGACVADTGGTCLLVGCYKSRGTGVSCSKEHKCLCQKGHCAVQGVCKPQR